MSGRQLCLPSDTPDVGVQHAIRDAIRVADEAFLLPHAAQSSESGAYKNVAFRLGADDAEPLSPALFGAGWGAGVSLVEVSAAGAERALARREHFLARLGDAIPSEVAETELLVGPKLDCDARDCDLEPWRAGFDSKACCAGLYSARVLKAAGAEGTEREHVRYFLLARAGGGQAAATFAARLTASLEAGSSLGKALADEGSPGAQALRRVASAGSRNRRRILLQAAKALDLDEVDAIPDPAALPGADARLAVTSADVAVNTLRKTSEAGRAAYLYSAGCVDLSANTAFISASNAADGFSLFLSADGGLRCGARSEAFNCLPFTTPRLASSLEVARRATETHKTNGHPDAQFVKSRFCWKNKEVGAGADAIEPLCLHGSHGTAALHKHSTELGTNSVKVVKLVPELVCLAGVEASKLRAVLKGLK